MGANVARRDGRARRGLGRFACKEDTMLKPALCAAALVVAAAVAFPAIAQQSPQGDNPSATSPAPQAGPEGRGGPGWRDGRDRYSDEDRPRRRHFEERRYGSDDDYGPRRWHGPRFGGRDGMMMERHAMRPFGMAHFCGPRGGRMAEVMISRLERVTQPTPQQRPAFDKLKDAVARAGETVRTACPAERPITPPGRLAAAEKRLTAMLEAVRLVRPAMNEYYGSLSDEQKARLYVSRFGQGPGSWEERREGRFGGREQYGNQNRSYGNQDRRDDRTQYDSDDDDDEMEHL
jgi:hypothetical protein